MGPLEPTLSGDLIPPKPLRHEPPRPVSPSEKRRRPLIPNRFSTFKRPISRPHSSIDRADIPPASRKPVGTRPTLPFIHRKRPGGRPTFLPPRKPLPLPTKHVLTTTEISEVSAPRITDDKIASKIEDELPSSTSLPPFAFKSTTTESKVSSDFASFLQNVVGNSGHEFQLPEPITKKPSLHSAEIENFLLPIKFQPGHVSNFLNPIGYFELHKILHYLSLRS